MYRRAGSSRNGFVLVGVLIAGLVLGGFAGEALSGVGFLKWLSAGRHIGLTSPAVLDLGVITLQFALSIKLTAAGVIGLLIGYFLYRKY